MKATNLNKWLLHTSVLSRIRWITSCNFRFESLYACFRALDSIPSFQLFPCLKNSGWMISWEREFYFVSPISLIGSKKNTEYVIRLELAGMWVGIKDITQQWGPQVVISLAGSITSLWQKLTEDGTERVQNECWCCFPLWHLLYPSFSHWAQCSSQNLSHWRHSLRTGLSMLPDGPADLEPQGFLLAFNFFPIRCEC